MTLGNRAFILLVLSVFGATGAPDLDRPFVASFSEAVKPDPGQHSVPPVPLFYGWFYNTSVAESISMIGKKYFMECYDSTPPFQTFLNNLMRNANISNPLEYYKKPVDPDTQLEDMHYHTTALFCGRNESNQECIAYLKEIDQYIGRPYHMHLVGLFFTKNTFGIRVKLTLDEQKLFRVDDRSNDAQAAVEIETNDLEGIKSQGFQYEPYYFNKGSNGGDTSHPFYPGITFRPQEKSFHPTESRAHITLGCAPNIQAVQTGLDLLEIIDMEVSSFSYHHDFELGGKDVPKATFREYKVEDEFVSRAFVIYPEEEMITEASFDAYL